MEFLPLHVYTGYSFLKSGMSLPSFVHLAKKRGQHYCAISDYQTMTGFPELTALCQKNGLIPVYGMDVFVEGLCFSCYIQSEEGYQNLIAICLKASEGPLALDDLYSHKDGLSFILDGASPAVMDALEDDALAGLLGPMSKKLSFWLGLPYLPKNNGTIDKFRAFLSQYPYPYLAFPHLRYGKKGDAIALSIVDAIANDLTLEEKQVDGDQYYLEEGTLQSYYSEAELLEPFRFIEGGTFVFAKSRGALPQFPSDDGRHSILRLREDAYAGLAKKRPVHTPEYEQRLDYELGVIARMGYADYFLIVADYVHYAKSHGIAVGPGRGSGAGSLVSYCLDIVTIDPIKHGLLFERFLNPERQSMPDIDVDFADYRRDEVVHYLQQKYGVDRVAHIVTLQTLGAKASIRDVGRVYGYEARHIDMLAKAIGDNLDSLRENYKKNKTFRDLVDSDPYYLEIVSLASKIEGLPRQAGLHAAGIVLSQKPLAEVVPVIVSPGVGLVAQYEMLYLEEQGVLKMDLLGLRNLTLIDHCLSLIAKTHGEHLDYEAIPYKDKDAIALIAQGKTMGLFQLESRGMNRAIAIIAPTEFSDVVAIIALYRPGPMLQIPHFGARKKGKEPILYPSPALEPFLKETYGIIVYQEQVMQIVRALAGYSYAQADVFRRAISKKDNEKLESLRDDFLAACIRQGHGEKVAHGVWDLIIRFASYGFNKSHAVAYGKLACQMAYLKCHYPSEFYCAILDGTTSSDPKFLPLVHEIKGSGIRFALPSVNASSLRFLPESGAIRFPLTAIRGLPGNLSSAIINEREQNGPYKDLFDFALRNKPAGLTLNHFVRLIDAGCFDDFGPNRASLRLGAELVLTYAETFAGPTGNEALLELNFPRPELPSVAPTYRDDLKKERELLGLMVSGSPLKEKEDAIAQQGLFRLKELESEGKEGLFAAVVESVKTIVTKKGSRMAFLTLYDEESIVEVTLFAEVYDNAYPMLKEGSIVKVRIKRNYKRDGYTALSVEAL